MSKYGVGLRNVGSYMVSGQPFITGSAVNAGGEVRIEFPYVTKNITIRIPSPPNAAHNNESFTTRWQTDDARNASGVGGVYSLGDSQDFTINFWFRASVGHTVNQSPLFVMDGGVMRINFKMRGSPANSFSFGGAGNTAPPDITKWFMVTLSQHGSQHDFYINASNKKTGGARIGAWTDIVIPPNTGGAIAGEWDEMSVWNAGLSAAEVEELYNEGEWFNPNYHSKKNNLLTWHTFGDAAADNPNVEIQDLAFTNEPFYTFIAPPAAGGIFVDGAFASQKQGKIRIHMASTGSDSGANIVNHKHYQELQGYGTSIEIPAKTKEIYISGVGAQTTFEVIAELTNIQASSMYALTGSGIDE